MVTAQERQRAAELARGQVQQEAEAIADAATPALRVMSEAIVAIGAQGHPELRDDLTALKEHWRKTVFVYLQRLKRSAREDELHAAHALVDAMREESAEQREEPGAVGQPSIGRMRRVMARAVSEPAVEVLDAG